MTRSQELKPHDRQKPLPELTKISNLPRPIRSEHGGSAGRSNTIPIALTIKTATELAGKSDFRRRLILPFTWDRPHQRAKTQRETRQSAISSPLTPAVMVHLRLPHWQWISVVSALGIEVRRLFFLRWRHPTAAHPLIHHNPRRRSLLPLLDPPTSNHRRKPRSRSRRLRGLRIGTRILVCRMS